MQQLIITYDETTGNVNVNGPIGNKGMCYLMLECARDAVKDHVDKAQQAAPAIISADPFLAGNGRGGFDRRGKRKR